MSTRTRRAVEAELDRTETPPAVPRLEQAIRAEIAEHGPNSIRGLAIKLRAIADRGAIADTVMRLVATRTLLNAGRDPFSREMLYRLA